MTSLTMRDRLSLLGRIGELGRGQPGCWVDTRALYAGLSACRRRQVLADLRWLRAEGLVEVRTVVGEWEHPTSPSRRRRGELKVCQYRTPRLASGGAQ